MPTEKKFEYLIRNDFDFAEDSESELNELGKEGWELIGFQMDEGFSSFATYIFKRVV